MNIKQMLPVVAAIVVMGILIGYYGVHAPKQNEIRLIQAQVAEQQAHQQIAAEVAALLQQVERYRKRLPEEPDPSWLVRELVGLAQSSGVQFSSITQESPQLLEHFSRLSVNLQFNASYHQLGRFLDGIERSDRFIRVDRLRIGYLEEGGPVPIELTCSTLSVQPLLEAYPSGG